MKNNIRYFLKVHHLPYQLTIVLLLEVFLLMIASGWTQAHADMQFPDRISIIEDEAFLNVHGFSGVLTIPQTVIRVGDNAFSGTNPYAVVVPSTVEYFGKQNISSLSYIYFQGNTDVTAASVASAAYVIGPAGSSAEAAAQAASVPFVEIGDLYTIDDIYYQKIYDGFRLLSPVNSDSIQNNVTIPGTVGASVVIDALPTAFQYCFDLAQLELPNTLNNILTESFLPYGVSVNYNEVNLESNILRRDFEIVVPKQIRAGEDFIVRYYTNDYNGRIKIYSFDRTKSYGGRSGGIRSPEIYYGYDTSFTPGQYYVEIEFEDAGLISHAEFQVLDAVRPDSPIVTIEKEIFRIGEDVIFTINTEDADELHYIIWENDMGSDERYLVSENETKIIIPTSQLGNHKARFAIKKNGIWSRNSEYINYYVKIADSLDKPEIKQLVHEHISGKSIMIEWYMVSNAVCYSIECINSSGQTIYQINNDEIVSFGDYNRATIPGYILDCGTYNVVISASAPNYSKSATTRSIVISGTRPIAPSVISMNDGQKVAKSHLAQFMVNTNDCEQMIARYNGQYSDIIQVDSDFTEYSKMIGYNVGEKYSFSFSLYKDDVWSEWSDDIIITVVDQLKLIAPTITLPDQVNTGSSVSVKISSVEHTTNYNVVLYRNNQYIYGNSYSGAPSVTWQGYMLEPGIYTVEVTVSDYTGEYATNSNSATFTVTGNKSDPPMITSNIQEVMVQENYSFIIDTTGADRLAINYGTALGNYSSQEVWDTETVWRTYSYSAGTYSYRFALRKNGVWTAWSDPVSVIVRAAEKLSAPSLTIAETFVAGQNVGLSFTTVENATNYRVKVYDSESNTILDNSVTVTDGEGQWFIPGYRLTTGEYTVTVIASASGYASSSASSSFIVTGSRPLAATFTLYNTEVDTWSADYWTLIFKSDDLSDVESVVSRSWVQGDTNLYYTTYDVTENNTCQTKRWIYSGNTYCYSFSVLRNGIWSNWSQVIRITP